MRALRVGCVALAILVPAARAPLEAQTITTAGEFSVEPPTLALARLRLEDHRRRQPQRAGRADLPEEGRDGVEAGPAAAAPAARVGERRAAAADRQPADAALPVRLRRAEHVLGERAQPRAGHRIRMPPRAVGSGRRARRGDEDRDRADAPGAAAGGRGKDVPRVSGRLDRAEGGAGVHRADERVLHGDGALRLPERLPGAREAGRRHPGARGPVRQRSLPLHERRRAARVSVARHGVRRHLLPDGERDGRPADRDQGRGRRRGDLRRRRRAEPVQPDGRELQLLRGPDDPQHQRRVSHRHQGHRRLERLHAEALAASTTSAAPCRTTGRDRRTTTSPTTRSSAATIPTG